MELIDSHCHLDLPAFDDDRDTVLASARARGVSGFVIPAVQAAGWPALAALCERERDLYPAYGLHPVFLDRHVDRHIDALQEWLAGHDAVAVGEIGLDYHVPGLDRDRQQYLFEAQLETARTAGLPVILHVLKSHERVLDTLQRIRVSGGIVHAFNGSLQQAARYRDLGFVFGFGGMLTYERSTRLHALAASLPPDAIVLETDAPDMTVMQHRGERNSPEYLTFCLQALAAVRAVDEESIAAQTSANVHAVLPLQAWQARRH